MTDIEIAITSEEHEDARADYSIAGWYCPYDREFIGYEDSCNRHNVSPMEDGPSRGYEIQDAFWFDMIGLYKVIDEDTFVTDPRTGVYREYTKDEILVDTI